MNFHHFQASVANCETRVTDEEREVMQRTNRYQIENEKDRLLNEAKGKFTSIERIS